MCSFQRTRCVCVSFRKQLRWKLPIKEKLERASIKATRCMLSTWRVLEPSSVVSPSIFRFDFHDNSICLRFLFIFLQRFTVLVDPPVLKTARKIPADIKTFFILVAKKAVYDQKLPIQVTWGGARDSLAADSARIYSCNDVGCCVSSINSLRR